MWPTPVAHDDGKTPEAHLAMKARMKGGPRRKITSLAVMVKATERGLWPTPIARDKRTFKGAQRSPNAQGGEPLTVQVGGTLNPTWVEWLMRFPTGWTDCDAWATPSSPR